MIFAASVLLTLGVVDLVRWSPEPTTARRATLAAVVGVLPAAALAVVSAGGGGRSWVLVVGLVPAVAGVLADTPGSVAVD